MAEVCTEEFGMRIHYSVIRLDQNKYFRMLANGNVVHVSRREGLGYVRSCWGLRLLYNPQFLTTTAVWERVREYPTEDYLTLR